MDDEPNNLIIIHGLSGEALHTRIREELKKWACHKGIPILPYNSEFEMKIIPLQPARIEPDIEDEP
jgi:hypothetical protein